MRIAEGLANAAASPIASLSVILAAIILPYLLPLTVRMFTFGTDAFVFVLKHARERSNGFKHQVP
jgi:hypothetical protein